MVLPSKETPSRHYDFLSVDGFVLVSDESFNSQQSANVQYNIFMETICLAITYFGSYL